MIDVGKERSRTIALCQSYARQAEHSFWGNHFNIHTYPSIELRERARIIIISEQEISAAYSKAALSLRLFLLETQEPPL